MLRRIAIGMMVLGFSTLLLPCVFGRPPIGFAEARHHRHLMIAAIAGGALLTFVGAVTAYFVDRSDGEEP